MVSEDTYDGSYTVRMFENHCPTRSSHALCLCLCHGSQIIGSFQSVATKSLCAFQTRTTEAARLSKTSATSSYAIQKRKQEAQAQRCDQVMNQRVRATYVKFSIAFFKLSYLCSNLLEWTSDHCSTLPKPVHADRDKGEIVVQ